jgi:predicted AlkP superfamily phosphohydrolase/phosphomutase
MRNRTLILGLDGATWEIITPMVDQGHLPNLGRLMARGAWGVLKSSMPPISPVAWTSLVTGVNPGRHGIHDFVIRDPEKEGVDMKFLCGGDRRCDAVWRFLTLAGRTSVALNIPMTFPPEEIKGAMVSGMDAPEMTRFTFPESLGDRIRERFPDYAIEPPSILSEHRNRTPRETIEAFEGVIAQKRDLALWLMGEIDWDFFMVVFESLDRAQHLFTRDYDWSPGSCEPPDREIVPSLYRAMDKAVGDLLDAVDDTTGVLVVSDHGFHPARWSVLLNAWLISRGYMVLKDSHELRMKRYKGLAKEWLKERLPAEVVRLIQHRWRKNGAGSYRYASLYQDVDWERTQVYSEGPAPKLFINPRRVRGAAARDALVRDLIAELKDLKDPLGSDTIFKTVARREEFYHGPFAHEAADILLELNRGFLLKHYHTETFLRNQAFLESLDTPGGEHHRDGILIASGPGIRAGKLDAPAEIVDVVPTVLYLMGERIPDNLDGKVLSSIIEGDRAPTHAPGTGHALRTDAVPPTPFGDREKELLNERLRELGYL